MIIGINKRRFSFFVFWIVLAITASVGYKPFMKAYFYPKKFREYVEPAAEKYNVDANLIYAVIKAESGFETNAVSHADAKGLMQITDYTAQWAMEQLGMKGADIFSPEVNITIGTWYISKLLNDNGNNLITALASYNAGGSNVKEWQKSAGTDNIMPEDMEFKETGNYVNKTMRFYDKYKKLWN